MRISTRKIKISDDQQSLGSEEGPSKGAEPRSAGDRRLEAPRLDDWL